MLGPAPDGPGSDRPPGAVVASPGSGPPVPTAMTRWSDSRATGGRPRSQCVRAYDAPEWSSSATMAPVTGSARNGLISSQGMCGSSDSTRSDRTPRP